MRGETTTAAAARYHPGVIWGPFVLAVVLGLLVSAGLYFAYLWPSVEPDDERSDDERGDDSGETDP
jgi:hypothetical protein